MGERVMCVDHGIQVNIHTTHLFHADVGCEMSENVRKCGIDIVVRAFANFCRAHMRWALEVRVQAQGHDARASVFWVRGRGLVKETGSHARAQKGDSDKGK